MLLNGGITLQQAAAGECPYYRTNTHDDHELKAMPIIQFSLQRDYCVPVLRLRRQKPHPSGQTPQGGFRFLQTLNNTATQ